jgi:hypothetical protein
MGLYGQHGFKNDFAPAYAGGVGTMVDGQGTTHAMMPTGAEALSYQQSNLGFGTQITNAMRSSVSTQLSHSQESAWQNTSAYGQSLASNYSDIKRFVDQNSSGTGVSQEFRMQDGTSVQQELGELTSITNNFASKYGVSNDQAVAMIGTAGFGGNIPLTKIGADIKASFKNQDTLQKAWSEAQELNQSTNFSERYQNVSSAVQAEAARVSSEHNDSFAGEVAGGLSRQTQYRDDTQASYRNVDQWQNTKSRVDDQSFSFQGDVGMAVRRFMIEEENRSSADVDNIIHRHNMGDTSATATLSDSVSYFAQVHGKELAGIQTAPDAQTVSDSGNTRANEISDRRSHVTESGDSDSTTVQEAARRAGIPGERDVSDNAATVFDESGLGMDATNSRIDTGRASLTTGGQKLEETVKDKQRIYSVGTAPGIHETMDKVKTKLTNKFSELFD